MTARSKSLSLALAATVLAAAGLGFWQWHKHRGDTGALPNQAEVGSAQAFALAVDRVVAMGELADRKAHLERAIQSHRLVGQAVGILVERHRLTPGDAFQRLQRASQDRNLKLRELAQRVIESGLDPKDA